MRPRWVAAAAALLLLAWSDARLLAALRAFALSGARRPSSPRGYSWRAGSKARTPQTARQAGAGEPDASPWDKAVWSAAEALGTLKATLAGEGGEWPSDVEGEPAKSREELVDRLRADYDRSYFLTGDIDVPLYTEDCEFADPFASFRGRERFVRNLRNLAGGFITSFNVKLLDLDVEGGADARSVLVKSRLRVVLELGLPWRPVLGWVWGVTHECDASSSPDGGGDIWQCSVHREAWEIDPAEGVAMVFRPGRGLRGSG